jgi:hypothetical protein
MAKLEGLVAFRAALELLKERNQYHIVEEVYLKCKAQENYKDTTITKLRLFMSHSSRKRFQIKFGDVKFSGD